MHIIALDGFVEETKLIDSKGNEVGTKANKIVVESNSSNDVLQDILKCLKIIEIHLSSISGDELTFDNVSNIDDIY